MLTRDQLHVFVDASRDLSDLFDVLGMFMKPCVVVLKKLGERFDDLSFACSERLELYQGSQKSN